MWPHPTQGEDLIVDAKLSVDHVALCADGRDVSFAETPEADARDAAASALRRPSPLSRVQSEFFTPAASLANPPGAGGGGSDGDDGLPSVSQLQVQVGSPCAARFPCLCPFMSGSTGVAGT